MIKIVPIEATLALGGGSSACSRQTYDSMHERARYNQASDLHCRTLVRGLCVLAARAGQKVRSGPRRQAHVYAETLLDINRRKRRSVFDAADFLSVVHRIAPLRHTLDDNEP